MTCTMRAKRIIKNHKWLGDGMSCTCGPGGHDPAMKSERRGRLVKGLPRPTAGLVGGMGAEEAKDRHPPARGKPGRPTSPQWAREMRLLPCHYCGGEGGTIDHVIPKSAGGRTILKNCVPACAPCNTFRGNAPYQAFKDVGWKKRPFAGVKGNA